MNLTDCLKGRRSEEWLGSMADSGATDITVTIANFVYYVRCDVAGNVRGHQTSCKEPSKGSLEQKHDYSNVQEAK